MLQLKPALRSFLSRQSVIADGSCARRFSQRTCCCSTNHSHPLTTVGETPRANPTLPPIPQEQKILQIFRRRMMQDHHCTTAAGKTTLPSILAGFVPEDERIVLIEDRPRIHQSEKRAAVRGETSSKDARTVADLYPDVVNAELEEVQRRRGLETQEPFVNTTLANHSLSLLCALVPLR
jgi:hypothetical protein